MRKKTGTESTCGEVNKMDTLVYATRAKKEAAYPTCPNFAGLRKILGTLSAQLAAMGVFWDTGSLRIRGGFAVRIARFRAPLV